MCTETCRHSTSYKKTNGKHVMYITFMKAPHYKTLPPYDICNLQFQDHTQPENMADASLSITTGIKLKQSTLPPRITSCFPDRTLQVKYQLFKNVCLLKRKKSKIRNTKEMVKPTKTKYRTRIKVQNQTANVNQICNCFIPHY